MSSNLLQRAQMLLAMNRPREAAQLASRQLAASPSDVDAWIALARSFESMQEPARALECANRAIGLEPANADAHLLASVALASLENSREAVRAAEEAVRLAPMSARAHAILAISLTSRADNQSAFGLFLPRHLKRAAYHAAQSIRLRPTETFGYFAAGYVAARSGRPRKARAHYHRVLALDPQHAAAMNNLAVLDIGRGLVARGGSHLSKALAADPSFNLARRNVEKMMHNLVFAFHALAWLIYFCFSGIAANQQTGSLTFAWTTRCTAAVWLASAYALAVAATYFRQDRRVRALAWQMVKESRKRQAILLADVLTLGCFLISTAGQGAAATNVYLVGVLGIAIAWIGIAISKPRLHPR